MSNCFVCGIKTDKSRCNLRKVVSLSIFFTRLISESFCSSSFELQEEEEGETVVCHLFINKWESWNMKGKSWCKVVVDAIVIDAKEVVNAKAVASAIASICVLYW